MQSLRSAAVQYTNYGTGGAFELPTQSGTCNSCIMCPSDLPDMYTQARGPLGPRAWVYISGKSRGHVIQLICTM